MISISPQKYKTFIVIVWISKYFSIHHTEAMKPGAKNIIATNTTRDKSSDNFSATFSFISTTQQHKSNDR